MRALLGGVLVVHGVAHLVGFVVPWRIVSSGEGPCWTTCSGLTSARVGVRAVGLAWLVVAVLFVALGAAVLRQAAWQYRGHCRARRGLGRSLRAGPAGIAPWASGQCLDRCAIPSSGGSWDLSGSVMQDLLLWPRSARSLTATDYTDFTGRDLRVLSASKCYPCHPWLTSRALCGASSTWHQFRSGGRLFRAAHDREIESSSTGFGLRRSYVQLAVAEVLVLSAVVAVALALASQTSR